MSYNLTQAKDAMVADLEAAQAEYLASLERISSFTLPGQFNIPTTLFPRPEAFDTLTTSFSTIRDIISNIEYEPPTRPQSLIVEQPERYTDHVWEAQEMEDVASSLSRYISEERLASVNSPQEALMQETLRSQEEIDKRELEQNMYKLHSDWADSGFEGTPDGLFFDAAWLTQQYNEKRFGKTRNAFEDTAKFAQNSFQWSHALALQVEQIHADFAIECASIYKSNIQNIIKIYMADVDAALKKLEAETKQAQAVLIFKDLETDQDTLYIELQLEKYRAELEVFMSGFISTISSNSDLSIAKLDAAKSVAEGYKGLFSAISARFSDVNLQVTES